MSNHPEPAGIYVHVPFCRRICPYCDFAVTLGKEQARRDFVSALLREIELARRELGPEIHRRGFDTVYFGGGTPSCLEPEELARILVSLRTAFPFSETPRVFFEANPEDVTESSLRALRDLGVTFLSLGVQSFDDEVLRFLGRKHRGELARHGVEVALAAGFETVSVDLIYGVPGFVRPLWEATLEEAARFAPQHISCYQLTVHEGTPFFRFRETGRLSELGEEEMADFFILTHEILAGKGYEGYEVSNFAVSSEHRSRHNSKYWRHVPYVGLGPSAHGFDGRVRSWNARELREWSRLVGEGRLPRQGSEEPGPTELALELLMLRLRTKEGLDLGEMRERTDVDLERVAATALDRLVGQGLLVREGSWIRPTLRGLAVADSLVRSLPLS